MLIKNYLYAGLALWFWSVICINLGFSQDPIYSQYNVPNMYLNPALAGYEGALNIYSISRRQWWNLQGGNTKFNTNSIGLSFYNRVLRAGVGFAYNENVEGNQGQLKWKNIGGSYSYTIPLGDKSLNKINGDIRLGLNLSYNWRDFNMSDLVFYADLDPQRGIIGTTQIPNLGYQEIGRAYTDVGAGIAFRYGFVFKNGSRRLIEEKHMVVQLGLASHHLTRPDQSLFPGTSASRLPIRWTLHGSVLFNTLYTGLDGQNLLQVAPSFKVEVQEVGYLDNNFNPFSRDAYYMAVNYGAIISMSGAFGRTGLYGGIFHRNRNVLPDQFNTNALIFMLGTEIRHRDNDSLYKIAISYDVNGTGLGNTNTGGAVEISFSMLFPKGSTDGLFSGSSCPALR